jgi:hydroxymethylbilane synthase
MTPHSASLRHSVPASLRIGTRASKLALWQTEYVREKLRATGYESRAVEIRTTGDVVQDVPLSRLEGRAFFTKQIDDALLAGEIDLAVHSLKDLPTILPEGIVIAAVSEREDPSDALVGRGAPATRDSRPATWDSLPHHATVATSSLRRRAQLLHVRQDLAIVDLRGNVDTRLRKLDASDEWSAIILASAGLTRLGLADRIGQRLPPEVMLPAPGQGALAVTAREGDKASAKAARAAVHHAPSAMATLAERAFLRALEGGCQVPVAALAVLTGGMLGLQGRVVALGGERSVQGEETAPAVNEQAAEAVGIALAERLLDDGADEILAAVRGGPAPVVPEP